MNNNCPKCKQEAITFWKKLTLGSLKKTKCPICGANLKLAMIPNIVVLLLGQVIMLFGGVISLELIRGVVLPVTSGIWITISLFTVGMLATFPIVAYAHNKWVPLITNDS